jgi:hypothetical protein
MSSSKRPVVTIEGSVTPSVILPRGQRRTVTLTDRVQRLIERGFVVVVDWQDPEPERKAAPKAKVVKDDTAPDDDA